MSEWPTKGTWGAMPSAAYVDEPREGLDSYHLHRWLEHKEGEPYEQWYAFFAEKAEVEEAAEYLNTLEGQRQSAWDAMKVALEDAERLEERVKELSAWRYMAFPCPICLRYRVEYKPDTHELKCEKCGSDKEVMELEWDKLTEEAHG